MWLITGPFDSDTQIDVIPDKTKLLQSATTYPIGRQKESALRINHKKVSRNNGEIVIGEHTPDDVTNPAVVPALTFRNTRDSGIRVTRGDKSFIVLANTDRGLESGDLVRLAAGINFTVVWRPVVCFISDEASTCAADNTVCASLGIKLITKHTRDTTHHVTPSISPPLHGTILLSLLNQALIVTPEWFATLLGSANALYQTYESIPETDFIPDIDPQLSTIHQNPNILSRNERRKGLFEDITFVFAIIGSGTGTETKAMADIVIRGGAQRNLVDVEKEANNTSKSPWETLLRKKVNLIREGMGSGLVLVGDDAKMRERGVPRDIKKTWEAMLEKARIAGLKVIHPSAVCEAILNTNISLLDCTLLSNEEQGQSARMQVDEPSQRHTEPAKNEPTQQIEPSSSGRPLRRLTRRAVSKPPVGASPSPPPVAVPVPVQESIASAIVKDKPQDPDLEIEEVAQPKKKVLKRRAKTTGLVNALLGVDEDDHPSSLVPQNAPVESPVVNANVIVPPSPGDPPVSQPRRPLKRRARGNSQSQYTVPLEPGDDDETRAPQLKKFKALFEESGRGEIQSLPIEEGEDAPGDSVQRIRLEALREEEEETQSQSHLSDKRPPPLSIKRKLDSIEEAEEASENVEIGKSQNQPSKKRAIEGDNAIGHSNNQLDIGAPGGSEIESNEIRTQSFPNKKTTKIKGAAPGKPDTDPSFLMAIASLKRGKRTEDDFDREFNQLRISKPKLTNGGGSKENEAPWNWGGIDNFERDIGIRGNFMQIVEIDVRRGNQSRSQRTSAERYQGERVDWEGRQNFKKFKKNARNGEREVIPLVATSSESFVEEPSIDYRPHARPITKPGPSKKVQIVFAEDSDEHQEEGHPVLTNKNKNKFVTARQRAPARSQNNPPSSSNRKISQATLVADDDDDDEEEGIRTLSGRSAGRSLQQKTNTQPVASSSSKKVSEPLFVDDDSEDEIENVALPKRALRSTQGQNLSQSQSQNMMDIDETLKSDPKSASQPQTTARGRKRKLSPVPIVEDEDDDEDGGGTFGGFSRRGAAKRRK